MGTRGPVPKRSEEQLGHAHGPKDEVEPDKVPGGAVVTIPPANPFWHPVAKMMWAAFGETGMSKFYESTDWATAYLVCDQISLKMGQVYLGMQTVGPAGRQEPLYGRVPMGGTDLNAIMSTLGKLGVTEGDRRRMQIELQRDPEGPEEQSEGQSAVADVQAGLRLVQGGAAS